jgi:hypothetical protein
MNISLNLFFLKRGQKLCPKLLVKKKRIAQLINGKLCENRYNKPQTNNLDNNTTNKLARPTTTENQSTTPQTKHTECTRQTEPGPSIKQKQKISM